MNPENRQVISSATKWAHREPRPIHTPKIPTDRNREGPPDSPGGMGGGGGGDTQGQSTLMLTSETFKGKNGSKPDSV
jgi:hypothetical protein